MVTGAAGFIGAELTKALEQSGHEVLGIDSYSDYYSPDMKRMHVNSLGISQKVLNVDVRDDSAIDKIFGQFRPDAVVHLAAQGGVRASRQSPEPYIESNQMGFVNILRECEKSGVAKFLYASSSSVYGDQKNGPFKEELKLSAPKSLYALSKLSNEIVAQGLPGVTTQRVGMRFFTVYGPWGRPDMAVFRILAAAILDRPFKLTAEPTVLRDFTYVGDLVETVTGLIHHEGLGRHEVFNIAGGQPHQLQEIFKFIGQQSKDLQIERNAADPLDVQLTFGSTLKLEKFGVKVPSTSIQTGLAATWTWLNTIPRSELESWHDYSCL